MSTKNTKKAGGTAMAAAAKKATSKKAPATAAPKHPAKSVAGTLTLPAVGQKLTRSYHGKEVVVEITKEGLRHEGTTYSSLTAIAKQITGYKAISGPAFFGLWKRATAEDK
jgi:sRNA-binding protein